MGEIDDWRERHAETALERRDEPRHGRREGWREEKKRKEKREKEEGENKKNWRIGSQKKDSRLARHVMSWEAH